MALETPLRTVSIQTGPSRVTPVLETKSVLRTMPLPSRLLLEHVRCHHAHPPVQQGHAADQREQRRHLGAERMAALVFYYHF